MHSTKAWPGHATYEVLHAFMHCAFGADIQLRYVHKRLPIVQEMRSIQIKSIKTIKCLSGPKFTIVPQVKVDLNFED